MKKKVLVTGITGQDGSYLAEYLLRKNYLVFGIGKSRESLSSDLINAIEGFYEFDFLEPTPNILKSIILDISPDEIYHLAAFHFSSAEDGNNRMEFDSFNRINLIAANIFLETIKNNLNNCRFFYAASSHVFGRVEKFPQTEEFSYRPESLYAITKAAGSHLCHFYRNYYKVYASVGILYNHESPRRQISFITSQIADCAVRAKNGLNPKLVVRDLDAIVDWGSAEDYVEAMWLTLQPEVSDTYIISSGTGRTIREFTKIAFEYLNLDYQQFVFQDPNVISKQTVFYIGDCSKIKKVCNWHPKKSFNDLVEEMVQSIMNKSLL